MSALNKLKEEQQASTQLSASSEQLKQIDETLRVLIATLTSQSDRIKKVEDSQASLMLALSSKSSTSTDSVNDSLVSELNAFKKTLNKQSATLSALGETVSDKRIVKQSDGSSVSASELQAHSMMKQLNSNLTKTTSALDELKQVVGNGRTVRVDVDRLSEFTVGVLDQRLSQAVEAPIKRVESTLEGFEHRVASLGAERLSEVHRAVEKSLSELNEARRNIEAIERRVTFVGISRLALAVLPLFASLLLVGGLVWGFGSMVGIGPLFGWAWGSFMAASLWWQKALVAAATLGGAALFVWLVLRVSRWVYEELR